MANFRTQNLPETYSNSSEDYLIVNQLSSGIYESKRLRISDIKMELATNDSLGGVKLGFPEYQDKNKYPLSIDEDGNGFFCVHWVDNVVISGEYVPELSVIRILVDEIPEPKEIIIDVSHLIDTYVGDEITVEQRNNVFRLKDSSFLLKGDHVEYNKGRNGDTIFRKIREDQSTVGTQYQQILAETTDETELHSPEKMRGRMYYSRSLSALFFKQNDQLIYRLKTPLE